MLYNVKYISKKNWFTYHNNIYSYFKYAKGDENEVWENVMELYERPLYFNIAFVILCYCRYMIVFRRWENKVMLFNIFSKKLPKIFTF